MIIELINTGSELMLGRVLNSHQRWLGRQLADLGCVVTRQVAVADTAAEICQAVRESLSRADVIIVTGGLGPTSDDLTREAIAELLGKKLRENEEIAARIQAFFARRNRSMPANVLRQASVPEGAVILPNPNGTAPGLAIEVNPNSFRSGGGGTWLMMLPGPPRELQPMFLDSVAPRLRSLFSSAPPFVCRTLRTAGVGESAVQEVIEGPLRGLMEAGLEIGYCARPGHTDVRLSARGEKAQNWVQEADAITRNLLGSAVFGVEDEELEEVVIHLLGKLGRTLSLAESCTGGYLANRLTNVPGASAVFRAGLVTYSNEAKKQFLGVNEDTLSRHGAVSEATAREMAAGVQRALETDYAIAVTGIAGPGGGTPQKPVGLVFIAIASPQGIEVRERHNPLDRLSFKEVTARQALDALRLSIQAE